MPTVNYHTVGGLLLGETPSSGARLDYLTDAVGSVVATADQTALVRNEYRYAPYGRETARLGPDPDPAFLWTGESGSRSSGASHAGGYNRARHYARETGRWTTVDPLWPGEPAYAYVGGNPVTWGDPDGRRPAKTGCKVWICHARQKLSHACVVVEGPQGGCSYSSYPSGPERCNIDPSDRQLYDCTLQSSDCDHAGHVCACIKEGWNDPYIPWVCWGNARNKVCCGCHRLPPAKRGGCESRNCAPAFQQCDPPVSGGGGGLPCK